MLRMTRCFLLLIAFLLFASPVHSQSVVDRGKLLYENHCQKCHESNVHTRDDRKVKNLVDLSKWVIRWQHHLELDWSYQEVRDVMHYLNQEFYQLNESP